MVVVGFNYSRYTSFNDEQIKIASAATQGLSNLVEIFIEEQQRQVQLFAHTNANLIHQSLKDPDNRKTELKLQRLIETRFPDHFAFTIADAKGILYHEDFDGKINEMCKIDIKEFAKTDTSLPRIHPNAEVYHFDVMALLENKKILFISFNASMLGKIINSIQYTGHELILAFRDKNILIEATKLGARNKQFRTNYTLNKQEENRILFSRNIPSTKWSAIDLYEEAFYEDKKTELIWQSSAALVVFILFFALATLPFTRAK